jgi:UDP-N-acetylmuramoylalanine--D-glutamate ligase
MLADALEACRARQPVAFTAVRLGGNIGRSLLPQLQDMRPSDLVVLEMSNAQLEDLPRISWAPSIVVITNLSPHHLDRHGGYGEYVAAKLNIVGDPETTGKVIVGPVDAGADAIIRRAIPDAGRLGRVTPPAPPVELVVPGEHNRANAACVLTLCSHLGLDEAAVRAALRSFRGLPHRLEHVRTFEGVDYYNDSKSTSPAATATALGVLENPVIAIVGGKDKAASLDECAAALARSCRLVICIGESGPRFARAVRQAAGRLSVPRPRQWRDAPRGTVRQVGRLDEAVRLARSEAAPGDAVLYSPGSPSFDAYPNFCERGLHFVRIVSSLA